MKRNMTTEEFAEQFDCPSIRWIPKPDEYPSQGHSYCQLRKTRVSLEDCAECEGVELEDEYE